MNSLILSLLLTAPSCSALPVPRKPAASDIVRPRKYTPEQRLEINKQARIELARRAIKKGDVLMWGRALFPEVFTIKFCEELHQDLVDIRHVQFASREAPRGHAKTTIQCLLIPLYQALNEPETYRHYLNIQATEIKSLDINRAIRLELEENELLIAMYGDQRGPRWTDQQFVTAEGVVFTARSAGQSLRGIKYRSLRPDYIIVDDLYDENELNNLEQTKKMNSWFWGTLYPARSKVRRSVVHVLGTAANKLDLLETFKTSKQWNSRTFKAVDFDKKTALWPELNTYDELMAEMAGGMPTVIWNREYQNERRDDSESIIKDAWIKSHDSITFGERHELISVELGVDPSIGEKVGSDATGQIKIYITHWADAPKDVFNYYVEGAWNERLSLNKRVDLVRRHGENQEPPVNRAHIEGIAGFKDFVAEVKRLTNVPVHEVNSVKNKLTNLENKSGYFENGRISISTKIPRAVRDLLIEQLTNNNPEHDDLRDAVLLVLPELSRKPRQRWRPIA